MTSTADPKPGAAPRDGVTEPLVLLPGFMTDARLWGAQVEVLGRDMPLMLAHWGPANAVDAMAEAVLAQAPPRFALAGHALGGMVAIEIVRRAPERVTRLALISTNCLSETPPAAAERDLRIARAKAGKLAEAMAAEVPEGCIGLSEYRGEIHGFAMRMALELGAETYLRQANALQRRPDQQRTLRQVKVPVLVCCGGDDTLHMPRRHEFMAGLVPKSELKVLEGVGHLPTIEAPDRMNEVLRAWMARVPAPQLLRQAGGA
ncbi:alpha/beta fold hydrolase [Oceaniglobus roseus]|uniref:alpha/beta fold hydrolase n=1 Tax=Oceaniglobus roseus TaxID=1737570 RepID=UPI001FE8F1EE|nr:alpha/beta hydrolase [Kandeliimicrobium roseum]